jgi:ABC-2 type transport system ATP-binding protein
MIEVQNLTKRFGARKAVDDLTFRAEGGQVTGFLGPNGAGKTTTMRMVLGLDRPTGGRASIDGRPLREHAAPLRAVGALLDAGAAAPRMTARAHLRWIARAGVVPDHRVDDLLELVGLGAVAGRRVGALSLGMRQRLGLAAALLGDPATLVLDEPINGLDPDGVRWMRTLLRGLAGEGRTVFISSHLMSEMQLTADTVVVIDRGRLVAELSMTELAGAAAPVRLRAPDPGPLLAALGPGVHVEHHGAALRITGATAEQIGDAAAATGVAVHELTPEQPSLEDVFLRLTTEGAVR